jgi:hypothetical protein
LVPFPIFKKNFMKKSKNLSQQIPYIGSLPYI